MPASENWKLKGVDKNSENLGKKGLFTIHDCTWSSIVLLLLVMRRRKLKGLYVFFGKNAKKRPF
jgi:hypothetical protein